MGQITFLGSYLLDYTLLGFVTQTLILSNSNLFRFRSVQLPPLPLSLLVSDPVGSTFLQTYYPYSLLVSEVGYPRDNYKIRLIIPFHYHSEMVLASIMVDGWGFGNGLDLPRGIAPSLHRP